MGRFGLAETGKKPQTIQSANAAAGRFDFI
jgi:hypothetical protein